MFYLQQHSVWTCKVCGQATKIGLAKATVQSGKWKVETLPGFISLSFISEVLLRASHSHTVSCDRLLQDQGQELLVGKATKKQQCHFRTGSVFLRRRLKSFMVTAGVLSLMTPLSQRTQLITGISTSGELLQGEILIQF